MKLSLDLPAPLLRNAKALSAQRGESLNDFVIAALQQHINDLQQKPAFAQVSPWMSYVGQLTPIQTHIAALQNDIDETFGGA